MTMFFERRALFPPVPAHPLQGRPTGNVTRRRTTCFIAPLFWLRACPDFCPGLQLDMAMGMFHSTRFCFFWPLPQAAVDDSDLTSLLFSVVQHSRPKCVHRRSVLDVNV